MPKYAELANKAIISGLQDDSFKQGYDAQAQNEKAKLEAYLKGKLAEHQAAMDVESERRRLAQIDELRAKDPKAAWLIGDKSVSVNPHDNTMRLMAERDKNDDKVRQETESLQKAYKEVMGKDTEKAKAVADVMNQLRNQTGLTRGMVKTALARLGGEVGVLTDKDIERIMPQSYGSKLKDWWTNSVRGEQEPTMTPEETKAMLNQVEVLAKPIQERLAGGRKEVETRAKYLAPRLSSSGKTGEILAGLGSLPESQTNAVTSPQQVMPQAPQSPSAQNQQRVPIKKQRNPKTGEIRQVYSDGSFEILPPQNPIVGR